MKTQTLAGGPSVRIGDVERDACVERLVENYAAGRLSAEELDRRQREALEAVTAADLAGLVADLPMTDSRGGPKTRRLPVSGFSGSDRAVKVATALGVPATFATGGVVVAAYADGASDVSQFSWAVAMGVAGYLTHWVVGKVKR